MHEVRRGVLLGLPVAAAVVAWFSLDDATQSSILKLLPTSSEPEPGFQRASVVVPLEEPGVPHNPVVVALHDYYTGLQATTNEKLESIRALTNLPGDIDRGCLDAVLADIDRLQEELHRRFRDFTNLVNEQGGVVSEAQSNQASYDLANIQAKIDGKIDSARVIALGGKSGFCA